eukprot:1158244-Prymnesium_polylepis.1
MACGRRVWRLLPRRTQGGPVHDEAGWRYARTALGAPGKEGVRRGRPPPRGVDGDGHRSRHPPQDLEAPRAEGDASLVRAASNAGSHSAWAHGLNCLRRRGYCIDWMLC